MKRKLDRPTPEEDAAIQRGIEADPDNPELTDEIFAQMRPAAEVMPAEFMAEQARRKRGPQRTPTKELVALRLDRDVLEALRGSGRGWQSRANAALRKSVLGG